VAVVEELHQTYQQVLVAWGVAVLVL